MQCIYILCANATTTQPLTQTHKISRSFDSATVVVSIDVHRCVYPQRKSITYIPYTVQCTHNVLYAESRKREKNYFEHYKILKSFIKNVIPTNKYIHNQTLKFNLKINGKSKNQKWCV